MGDSTSGLAGVVCQVCKKTWPSDQSICPDDGTWLHEETILEIGKRHRPMTAEQFPGLADRGRKFTGSMTGLGLPEEQARATGPDGELAPGTRIGDYEIEAKIGQGAMGTVYKAVHPAIGKNVAIKVMSPKLFDEPEAVKRFVAEARAVAVIDHPGIVDVFGFGRVADGRTYLVMEWLDGESLDACLRRGKLEFEEACQVIRQICRALEAAHAKGIIHRDLKPENVFLQRVDDDKPVVKLLDFGLAKVTNKEDRLVARTRTGQMLGTPLYMSPEQCKSKGVDKATDIYALGCMSYELLLGRVPFDFDNVAELISAHLVNEPPRPSELVPDVDPELEKLLLKMVAKDPSKRPPLGEIRRVIGMQISASSQPFGLLTPPAGIPIPTDIATSPPTEPAPPPPVAIVDAPPIASMVDLRNKRLAVVGIALLVLAIAIALVFVLS